MLNISLLSCIVVSVSSFLVGRDHGIRRRATCLKRFLQLAFCTRSLLSEQRLSSTLVFEECSQQTPSTSYRVKYRLKQHSLRLICNQTSSGFYLLLSGSDAVFDFLSEPLVGHLHLNAMYLYHWTGISLYKFVCTVDRTALSNRTMRSWTVSKELMRLHGN